MWLAMLMWACKGKGGDLPCEDTTCAEVVDDACAEVEGAKFESDEFGDWRLGDVAYRSCRALSPGTVPVLTRSWDLEAPGSVLIGSYAKWATDDGPSIYMGMIASIVLSPEGDAVRPMESTAAEWVEAEEIGIWAATTGDLTDLDGDGAADLLVATGGYEAFYYLPRADGGDVLGGALVPLPFRVHEIGDITGDSIPDIARFLTDDDGDDVLAVQAMPVEGELADQPWDTVLGGVVRYDWIDLEDRFVGGGWDHNADGINDMAVGAFTLTEDEGQVYVYDGPITEARTTGEADATLARFGSRCGADGTYRGCDEVGTYTKSAGDLDGDGYTDIAIASRGSYVDDMMFAGTVWILSGPLAGPMHIEAEATGTVLGEVDHSYMPTEMFTGGDLDGDGRDELVLAHQDARLFHGPVEGTRVYSDGITFIDMSWDPAYHITFDADVDGDAIDDMVMIHYTFSFMAGMHVWFSTLSDEWPRPWAL